MEAATFALPALLIGAYGVYRTGRRQPCSAPWLALRIGLLAAALGIWLWFGAPIAHVSLGPGWLAPAIYGLATASLVGLIGLELLRHHHEAAGRRLAAAFPNARGYVGHEPR